MGLCNPNGIVPSSPGLAPARHSQAKAGASEPTQGQRVFGSSTATRLWPRYIIQPNSKQQRQENISSLVLTARDPYCTTIR